MAPKMDTELNDMFMLSHYFCNSFKNVRQFSLRIAALFFIMQCSTNDGDAPRFYAVPAQQPAYQQPRYYSPYYYPAPNSRAYSNPYDFQPRYPYTYQSYGDNDQYYVAPVQYQSLEDYKPYSSAYETH